VDNFPGTTVQYNRLFSAEEGETAPEMHGYFTIDVIYCNNKFPWKRENHEYFS
jgi:hypothetical protein